MKALQGIGASKAVTIAPVLGAPEEAWQKWTKAAASLGEEDLRASVKQTLREVEAGAPASLGERAPDQRWLDHTCHIIESFSEEGAKELRECFEAGRRALGVQSNFAVLLAMTAECISEWRLAKDKEGAEP